MHIKCERCGGYMKKTRKVERNCLGLSIGLLLFVFGLILTFTGVGAVLGIPMILVAFFCGGKVTKVWRCRKCGCVIERC